MKKILCLIISLSFIPIFVNAANPKVETLKVENDGLNIKYTGTTEAGSHAVMCKLFDKDGVEVDRLSSAVDSKKFEGKLVASADGEFTLSCANYEGGDFKSVNVVISSSDKKDAANVSNPKTIDNIVKYIALMVIAASGVLATILYFKKKIK